ncbi:TPA: DUF1173 family protein [Pseudomonas aeruginosa]|uniref:DUF1173 family protein n=1 Tax=Pseudomonas aeruginosa TaxID=287 RepID=UPI0012DA28F8|nr:DUF1173 family protein [Pseudomonas aeruginosa]EKU7417960.1 DUF1173 family protein [Pseudomonas aeruginosa]MBF2891722.1 DUF1173 family protein [Pseudomonas aeruginosa]MBF2923872.1 DUF1173 family protein [Pseudomonas aeruginosa]MBF2938388.1 DUF1173 family protein [Pseudomonas aeruginosa]MBG5021166.1 DUF1173 family protein [Pseudomonas aeruginosa]
MHKYSIKIANTGKIFPPSEQSGKAWIDALEKAHRSTHGQCMCLDDDRGRPVSIRRLGENFYVARFRDTSHHHHKKCRFYAPSNEQSGMQGYTRQAVQIREDGDLAIRLDRALTPPRAGAPEPVLAPPQDRAARQRRNTMSLGGLLDLLWTEAELNTWHSDQPRKLSDQDVGGALLQQARRIHVGRRTLDEVLLLPAGKDKKEHDRNKEVVSNARRSGLRLVAIGPLAYFDPVRDSDMPYVRLGAPFGVPKLQIDEATRVALRRSYADELGAWQDGKKIYAIVQMALCPKSPGTFVDTADVLAISLLRLSERFIPLDSSYEGILEKQLVKAGRSFTKPMRFDHNDAVFPDFWLLDMECDYPIEVFGMNTPEYQQRKAVKRTHYANRQKYPKGWWYWDLFEHKEIPLLPSPASERA